MSDKKTKGHRSKKNKGGKGGKRKTTKKRTPQNQGPEYRSDPYEKIQERYNPVGWPSHETDAEQRKDHAEQSNASTRTIESSLAYRVRVVADESNTDDNADMSDASEMQNVSTIEENGMGGTESKVDDKDDMEILSHIKALTMYEMVEQVNTGASNTSKLLFLTNKQAQMLSKNDCSVDKSSVDKIFAAFKWHEPKLIINILSDKANGCPSLDPGNSGWGLAFPTKKKADKAFFRLVCFMRRVIIPLAVKTNALILCTASNCCISSVALMAALQTMESKTTERLTVLGFGTAISSWMKSSGSRDDSKSQFRQVSKQSPNWKSQQSIIEEECQWYIHEGREFVWKNGETKKEAGRGTATPALGGVDGGSACDLLPVQNMIIIDSYNAEKKIIGDKKPFEEFYNFFCGTLFARYGSVTFKTGRIGFNGQSGMMHCLNALDANSPVFLLDSVERPVRPRNNKKKIVDPRKIRLKLIEEIKTKHKATPRIVWVPYERFEGIWGRDKVKKKKKECKKKLQDCQEKGADTTTNPDNHRFFRIATESLVVDMIAYAEMLFEAKWERGGRKKVSLKEAIDTFANDDNEKHGKYAAELTEDIEGFLSWYMDSYDDFYHKRWNGKVADPVYIEKIKQATIMQATELITHPKVFGIATGDIARANKLLDKVILLDRLPAKQSLPGLKLLRECWDEHDITMHLASRYKLASYVMYILLLVLGVVIIVFVSIQTRANAYYDIEQVSAVLADANLTEATEALTTPVSLGFDVSIFWPTQWIAELGPILRVVIFLLTVLSTFIMGLMAYINPAARWHHLRAHASELVSIIWKYRTRTGVFYFERHSTASAKVDGNNIFTEKFNADKVLQQTLAEWRRRVVNSADLSMTLLQQKPTTEDSDVYKHGQYEKHELRASADDHYSPATPQLYYEKRLLPIIKFYQGRLEPYQCFRNGIHILVLLLAALSAIFAFFDQGLYVTIVTSITAAIVSLGEYSDVSTKIRRYSNTLEGLKNLESYWNSLDGIEQSSLKSVNHLVNTGETIISQEMFTWFSNFQRKGKAESSAKKEARKAGASV